MVPRASVYDPASGTWMVHGGRVKNVTVGGNRGQLRWLNGFGAFAAFADLEVFADLEAFEVFDPLRVFTESESEKPSLSAGVNFRLIFVTFDFAMMVPLSTGFNPRA